MRQLAPLVRIGRFQPKNPEDLGRQMALLEGAAQKKAQSDDARPPYTITAKQTGIYNAKPWEIARIDTTVAAGFVVLPNPLDNLGVWIGVKFAAGATNKTITVSAISSTIDGDATFVMNVPRQLVWFYATTDGWEKGPTL